MVFPLFDKDSTVFLECPDFNVHEANAIYMYITVILTVMCLIMHEMYWIISGFNKIDCIMKKRRARAMPPETSHITVFAVTQKTMPWEETMRRKKQPAFDKSKISDNYHPWKKLQFDPDQEIKLYTQIGI